MDIPTLSPHGPIRLHFITHSTYLLCAHSALLLFDYYSEADQIRSLLRSYSHLPLYIITTHSHGDHYHPSQFTAFADHPAGVHFICHEEVCQSVPPEYSELPTYVDTGATHDTGHFTLRSFGSTDAGGSFYIRLIQEEFDLFYAGDLNYWHWQEEASPEYVEQYTAAWQHELHRITHVLHTLDLLFFPTDTRLGRGYLLGLEQFLEQIITKHLAPMHLNGEITDTTPLEQLGPILLRDAIDAPRHPSLE